jgi:glycosyltransferase involved in cell wall biosynthesis
VAKVPVSAYLITFNNARTLEKALESLSWVDEIVVVDSFSTDATPEIARKYANRFEQRKWPGFRDQYQYASTRCTHDWVLFLDADEEVSQELATEIQEELARNAARSAPDRVAGYNGHRRTWYLGRWILHGGWVPDFEIRVYDRRQGAWKGDLHAKVHVDGPVRDLHGFLYHYTYADVSEQLQTIDRYSTTAAEDMLRNGKRFSFFHMLGNPAFRFVRDYVLKRGFLDGFPGLVVALNTAFYVLAKYAKLWELQHVKNQIDPRDSRSG